ncbi:La-related protein [Striga asiatica]|uniref:La-related protein n=1 Tax=Striga asiatica TaxID=4170 RepID=A0A5A7RBE7_STRAF|nr:La-related protein [Striga asiatica]
MGSEDNGGGAGCDLLDNQNNVVVEGAPMSPWKTSAAASPVMEADSDSWPAFSGAHQRAKSNGSADSLSAKPPSSPAQAETNGCGPPLAAVAPATNEQQKFHGRGNSKYHRRPNSTHQNRSGPKHGPNSVPPFPVPLPYHPPAVSLPFHPMASVPPVNPSGYTYQFPPGTLPRPGDSRAPSFLPPQNGSSQPQPAPLPDSNASDWGSAGGRRSKKEEQGQVTASWNNHRPAASNNFRLQGAMGPRPFVRPPFLGSADFVNGPNISGPPGTIYYYPAPPPGSVRLQYPPFVVPFPVNPGVPMPPSPAMALRAGIVKQIEYYFSDQNLQYDHYLKSLMDNQGWVAISIIAGFQRVKKMNVDIPFILDALQSSDTIEVQGEKVRRRHEWSKWVPDLTSKPSSLIRSDINNDKRDKTKTDNCDGKVECLSLDGSSERYQPFRSDIGKKSISDDAYEVKDLPSGETPKNTSENVDSSMTGCEFNSGNDGNQLISESNCKSVENHGSRTGQILPNPNVKKVDDSCCDVSNTFMLDEELEAEQTTLGNEHHSSVGRVDDEDDEVFVNDQAVERLVIVTQNSLMGEVSGEASKTISNELASAINDGLYFYEQELNSKRSHRRRNVPINNESKDEDRKYSDNNSAALNSEALNHTAETGNLEGHGNSTSRRKQKKGSSKQQCTHRQRFFYGSGINFQGIMSESPPTDAVGFFFGSTPPDSHGFRPSKLSASPKSNLSGSSPPVGSVPKPFPTFQHPSHKLLQENGFKQQLYKKYEKRCLSERKKFGIGRSEEMNTLYRFWCYFLRNMFITSMYNQFKNLALEDSSANYNYGMECLFRFYSYGLEKEFREDLYEDFEQLALDFYKKGNLYGLEKYW